MRDPEKTRSEILQAAYSEVYHRGFNNSSIDEILSKTHVTKGAFFHYFPSKSDLGYAIADELLTGITMERWIRPLTAYRNPVQGIIARFRKIIESTSDEDLAFGCPLNNLTQEMSSIDPVFRDKLAAVLDLWVDETEKHLKKAQLEGYLKSGVDTRQVATFIVTVEEGSFAIVKSLRDRKAWWSIYESLKRYLESINSQ